jgi:hypothetical protein
MEIHGDQWVSMGRWMPWATKDSKETDLWGSKGSCINGLRFHQEYQDNETWAQKVIFFGFNVKFYRGKAVTKRTRSKGEVVTGFTILVYVYICIFKVYK